MPITKFVANGNTYTFPPSPGDQDYNDNFKKVRTAYAQIPGADGGVDEFGMGRAPSNNGKITFGIYLISTTRTGMQPLRDALNVIRDWGAGQLYFQPTDTNLIPRWCNCRVSDIQIGEERQKNTDLWQPVHMVFEGEPFWYTPGNQILWDGGEVFDGSVDWDEGSFTAVTGSGSFAVTNNGSAFTHGRFVAQVTGAQGFNQLYVRRLNSTGGIVDEVLLQTSLVQDDVVEIDPRKQWVLVNGHSHIADFTFRFPDWLRLLPGSNTIQVVLDEAAAEIDAKVYYYERYT